MCGFVSMIGIQGDRPTIESLDSMSESIRHRGPDGSGRYVDGNVGFGFRRLSILDLSPRGHQPMVSDDGDTVIVFNGEIYNYIEVRAQLVQLGHSFRSSGDTEVLLNAYREWGEDCLERLNGMWAFLIYDRKAGRIFGARDRFGVKPLYWHRTSEWFLFASEIKGICASGLYTPSPNWNLAAQYLMEDRLSVPDERNETMYDGIFEVPAGSAFELDMQGRLREWQYWEIDGPGERGNDAIEEFADLFHDAVRLRMRSDVPVGVCLSGGLDSSAIICHMAAELQSSGDTIDGGLQAFSYTAPEFDEMPQIEATIEQTGASLNRLSLQPEQFWDRMPEVIAFQDEPVHSMNVVVSYELYRMSAANGVKVILNGQGADESLAGYPSYFRQYWFALLQSGRLAECWKEIGAYSRIHGADSKQLLARQLRYFLQAQLTRLSPYRRAGRFRRAKRLAMNDWFNEDLKHQFSPATGRFENQDLDTQLRKSMHAAPLPLYLRVEDRNSMANSVETRLPFLDYRLVNLAFNLANSMKLRGPWNKYILRQSMQGRMPDVVRNRVDKMGFPVPEAKWFSGVLYQNIADLLASQRVRERGIYCNQRILDDLAAFQSGRIDVSNRVFRVVQFEMFCDQMNRVHNSGGTGEFAAAQTGS